MHRECVCVAHVWKRSGDGVVASGRQNKDPPEKNALPLYLNDLQVIHYFHKEEKNPGTLGLMAQTQSTRNVFTSITQLWK